MEFARYVILFTDGFPGRRGAYLVFKRFKLGHLPKRDDESEAWLYGKLLVALLANAVAVSPWGYGGSGQRRMLHQVTTHLSLADSWDLRCLGLVNARLEYPLRACWASFADTTICTPPRRKTDKK